nr:hypothetical protein [Tanacetum cinerariifolium]
MGEDNNSWGDYEGFEGSNRISLVTNDGTMKHKNGAQNTIRTGFGTGANHTEERFCYDHRMRKIKMPLFDDLAKYREEVKGDLATLGNQLDSEVESLRKRKELVDKRYEEVKNMLLSLTTKETSTVRPVEPFKKVETELRFDDLGFSIPPTNTGTSPDGG